MWAGTAIIGVISGIVTFLINQNPDVGSRVTLFVFFGLFLGLNWLFFGITIMFVGMAIGAIVGALNYAMVSSIEGNLAQFSGLMRVLLIFLEWLGPTIFNTCVGGIP